MDSSLDAQQHQDSLPRLPPELIRQVIHSLAPAARLNDAQAHSTLAALCLVSRLTRHWALEARYDVLMLHRHVRDFKKWYEGMRNGSPPFICSGYTRAVFSGLDDVSRLTSFSSGWEVELLRLLHYCGQRVTHLSLWHAESRSLLRDAGQIRPETPRLPDGRRSSYAKQVPPWAVGQNMPFTDSSASSSSGDESDSGSSASEDEKARANAALHARREAAAARERARAQPPKWLTAELAASPDAARRHRAHLPSEPMEDISSREAKARRKQKSTYGCEPKAVSLCVGSPLVESAESWPRMKIWARVEEVDLFVPVTTYVPRVLELLATLKRSPLRRVRISSAHATLVLALPPFSRSDARHRATLAASEDETSPRRRPLNLARALGVILACPALKESVLNEFSASHLDAEQLEQAITHAVVASNSVPLTPGAGGGTGEARSATTATCCRLHAIHGAAPAPVLDRTPVLEPIRVRIAQRNQGVWGKLAVRRQDFLDRALGGHGAWATLGVWDEEEWQTCI